MADDYPEVEREVSLGARGDGEEVGNECRKCCHLRFLDTLFFLSDRVSFQYF